MKDLISYLTIENIVFVVVVLMFIAGTEVLIHRFLFNKREKRRKENPFILGIEHIDQLFKIREVEKDKNIAFLSFNPNSNYPSGKGGRWFSTVNIPKELVKEGQVLDVIKMSDKEIKIVEHSSF